MFDTGPELTFIQVGAFDGITGDPIQKYVEKCRWKGILIEPQARAADKLRQLYRTNDRIRVVQAALDRESRTRKIFTVDPRNGPSWAGGLASFELKTILKHCDLVPGLETMIREDTVDCITFEKVLERLPGEHLDLLQIDTEGADGFILSLFPFDRMKPAIIHWEIKHLARLEQEETLQRLQQHGYRFARSGGEDMLAVLR